MKAYYTIQVEHRPHIWVVVAYYKFLESAHREYPYYQQRYGADKTKVALIYE